MAVHKVYPRTAYTVRDAGHTQVAPHSRTVCAIGPAPADTLASIGCTELKLLWKTRRVHDPVFATLCKCMANVFFLIFFSFHNSILNSIMSTVPCCSPAYDCLCLVCHESWCIKAWRNSTENDSSMAVDRRYYNCRSFRFFCIARALQFLNLLPKCTIDQNRSMIVDGSCLTPVLHSK